MLVPAYWVHYGAGEFSVGLRHRAVVRRDGGGVVARKLWLLTSAMAVAVLVPEAVWNLDFFTRLIAGRDVIGLDATGYMFDAALPLWLRALSLFHVFLPLLLLWTVRRLGYDPRACGHHRALDCAAGDLLAHRPGQGTSTGPSAPKRPDRGYGYPVRGISPA